MKYQTFFFMLVSSFNLYPLLMHYIVIVLYNMTYFIMNADCFRDTQDNGVIWFYRS